MATQDLVKAKDAGRIGGGSPVIRHYPVEASASFAVGDFVKLHADGTAKRLVVCSSSAETEILGMALEASNATAGTKQPVLLAEPNQLFEVNVMHGTIASAVTTESNVGTTYGMTTSSNRVYCQIDDTTTDVFIVYDLAPQDAVGDQYGKVLVRVLSDIYQVGAREKTA